jgi:hypothetical protein
MKYKTYYRPINSPNMRLYFATYLINNNNIMGLEGETIDYDKLELKDIMPELFPLHLL